MFIPQKAIIRLETKENAIRLDEFIRKHLDRTLDIGERDDWSLACCDFEPHSGSLPQAGINDYKEWVQDFESGNRSYDSWVPEDPSLRFITVDDYMALCLSDEIEDSGDMNIEDLL